MAEGAYRLGRIGGLHAAVYLLKRTPQSFVHPSEQDGERCPGNTKIEMITNIYDISTKNSCFERKIVLKIWYKSLHHS